MMLSDNEMIKFLSVNANFYNSQISLIRKIFDMCQKKTLNEEEDRLGGLLLLLLNVRENHWCIL